MAKRTCIKDGCEEAVRGRGMCGKHYQRWRKTVDASILFKPQKHCSVDGCERTHKARGLCPFHYRHWLREQAECSVPLCSKPVKASALCSMHERRFTTHGTVGPPGYLRHQSLGAPCSVEGCGESHYAKGYCNFHWAKNNQTGEPGSALKRKRPPRKVGDRLKRSGGYIQVFFPDHPNASTQGVLTEHRLVMADMLERPLEPGETVHHKNGVRDDNRPENLELWSTTHPAGQAVADKLRFYTDLLSSVAPHADVLLTAEERGYLIAALHKALKDMGP